MYSYESTPYSTNRLQEFGLGAAPSLLGSMGYWASLSLRSVVKGYQGRRPSTSGGWVWFPTQSQALIYSAGSPVVVQPPVKPPVVRPPVIVQPPIVATNDTTTARYRIEGAIAYPLNDLARNAPPAAPLNSSPSYMWTRRVGDGAWLWKYVPSPDALYIEPVAVRPPVDTMSPANPLVKWYNKATGEIKDSRLLTAPDSSGSWILGSQAVAQGLVSAGALYGISAPGGGITVANGGSITAPVAGGMPAYIDGGTVAPVQAGVGSIPTWVWIAGGAAALMLFARKK